MEMNLSEREKAIVQYLQQRQNQNASTALIPKQEPKESGNLFTNLLPTITGTLGAVGGSFLAPGLGTVGGGAAGSAFGKWLQNTLEGKKDQGEGVIGEALLGGVGGIGGGLFKGAKALATGSKVADTAANATKPGFLSSLKGKIGQGLENYGNNRMAASQVDLTRAAQAKLGSNAADVFGNFNSEYGLSRLEDINNVGKLVTGPNGRVTEAVNNIVGSGRGVDIADASKILDDALINKGTALTNTQKSNLRDRVRALNVKNYGGAEGSLNPLASPLEVLDSGRQLQRQAFDQYLNKNPVSQTTADQQMGEILNDVGKEMRTRSYKQEFDPANFKPEIQNSLVEVQGELAKAQKAGDKGLISTLQKQEKELFERGSNQLFKDVINDRRSELISEIEKANRAGNTKLASALKVVQDKMANAKTLKDLNAIEAPFAKAGKMAQLSNDPASGASLNVGGLRQSALGLINDAAAPAVKAADLAIADKAARIGRALQGDRGAAGMPRAVIESTGQSRSIPKEIGKQAVRQSIPRTAANIFGGAAVADQGQDSNQAAAQYDPNSDPVLAELAGEQQSALPKEVADAAVIQAISQGDLDSAKAIMAASEFINGANGGGKQSAAQQKAILSANQAENTLNEVARQSQVLNTASGPLAAIFGGVQRLGAATQLNPGAAAYDSLVKSSAASIAKALGDSGALSDQDKAAAMEAIPKLGDSKETTAKKINQLRSILSKNREAAMIMQGGGDELMLASA